MSCLPPCTLNPFGKGSTVIGKNLLHMRSFFFLLQLTPFINSFPFTVNPLFRRETNKFDGIASHESVSCPQVKMTTGPSYFFYNKTGKLCYGGEGGEVTKVWISMVICYTLMLSMLCKISQQMTFCNVFLIFFHKIDFDIPCKLFPFMEC